MTDEIQAIVAEIKRREREERMTKIAACLFWFVAGMLFAYALWSAQP